MDTPAKGSLNVRAQLGPCAPQSFRENPEFKSSSSTIYSAMHCNIEERGSEVLALVCCIFDDQ